ncbi:MAG: Gldg family protein [Myxococcales bacterium]|nr:Gldg family protein [Myxococcales bacterium]MCB9709487.1 Gldg family protein [Myxococcales bacterium]
MTEPARGLSAPWSASRFRRIHHLSALIVVTLVLVVFGLVNYLAFRHYKRWDWTRDHLYTLSSRTHAVLRGLHEPVSVYVFLSESEPTFKEIKALLDRYRYASKYVAVHLVDPDRRPAEFDMLAKRFGVMAGQVLSTGELRADAAAVVATPEQRWIIKRDDLVGYADGENGDNAGDQIEVGAERALSGAIMQVTEGHPTRVCLSEGHGEWALEPREQRSVYPFKQELERDNIEMVAVTIRGKSAISADCQALFVIGPNRTFQPQEAEAVSEYLRQGGNALFALDPMIVREELVPTGLETVAERFGIQIENSVLVERDPNQLPQSSALERFYVSDFGAHPTTRALTTAEIPAVLHQARVVEPIHGSGAQMLLQTSAQAVAFSRVRDLQASLKNDTGLPADVRHGPLSIAVAGTESAAKSASDKLRNKSVAGRLVVVGDSDWLAMTYLEAPELANLYLASAWTGWLTERAALISIPPKRIRRGGVNWSVEDLNDLWWRLVVLVPFGMLLLGAVVWWRRKA